MATCISRFREEFKVTNLFLVHESLKDFQTSQFNRLKGKPFCVLRLLLAIYMVVSLLIAAIYYGNKNISLWGVYLTSINHILVTLHMCSSAVISAHYVIKSRESQPITEQEALAKNFSQSRPEEGDTVNLYMKFHWLLCNISTSCCLFVFISYWILVFPIDEDITKNPTLTYITIDRHGINLLIVLIDFVCSKTPFHLLHFIYPSCFICLYFISNIIYWSITKKLIYGKMLDYGASTGSAVGMVIAAVVVAVPIFHLLWFLLHLVKKKCCMHRETKDYELTNEDFAL
eukprot:gene6028-6729_t